MAAPTTLPLDARSLRRWPLPTVAPDADKNERGRVLLVAGSREIPGAALLAGEAVLRAGAGKLALFTAAAAAVQLAVALPEARVVGLPEAAGGAFALDGVSRVTAALANPDCALLGPGLVDEAASTDFVAALLPSLAGIPLVLDACAMQVVARVARFEQPVAFTPHAGEMAQLLDRPKAEIEADPQAIAASAAAQWNAVVALKGPSTFVAAPDGRVWRHDAGDAGLATSGSGDVLAGIAAGLAARGAPLEQALCWAVALHAMAGAALARRRGPIGYLPRELPGEIPGVMKKLCGRGTAGR